MQRVPAQPPLDARRRAVTAGWRAAPHRHDPDMASPRPDERTEVTGPDGIRLGHVYLPASGMGVGAFDFVVDRDNGDPVQIGTPVTADTAEGAMVGTVVDMRVVGWALNPHTADLEGIGEPGMPDDRSETMVATVAVADSPSLRPTRAGWVRGATATELANASGARITRWPITCGAVELADSTWAPLGISGENLVGPEGGHLIVGGLSGVASKTSFMGVLLRCVLASAEREGRRVGVLVWNVKGTDLIDIDSPPAPGFELDDRDRALWSALGVEPAPFSNVEVWAPALPGGGGTRSPRTDAIPLRWDLRALWPYLRYLLPHLYEDEKVASFIAEFRERMLHDPQNPIDTFDKLGRWFDSKLSEAEDSQTPYAWGHHHKATMWKIRRMLMSLPSRCGGLLSKASVRPEDDIPDAGWAPGTVRVVDIAGLATDVQGVALARTTERLLASAEEGRLGVDHLIIMVDELNQWAPAQGGDMAAVRRILQRVVTQGRYAGVSLWGAAQKPSKIDELVRDNSATRVLGRTADGELASGVYGKMPGGLAERVATLERGQALVWHPTFRTPALVRFPRPAWQTGRPVGDTRTRATSLDTVGDLSDKARSRLTSGLDPQAVDAIIADADDPELAAKALRDARTIDPHDVQLTASGARLDPDNPFDLP